jgi:diguanylate cyclase (GGDEF)-like protein
MEDVLKQWVVKLLQQLDVTFIKSESEVPHHLPVVNEEKATLLYLIDTYNKHLFEIENHSVRKVRDKLDSLAKAIVETDGKDLEKNLFEFRQFFSSYRIDEYSYIQNTFDDFKRIVWDFADHLSEDIKFETTKEKQMGTQLKDLKEAVEANSIEVLRQKSREFINSYVEYQNQKNELRQKRIVNVKKNMETIKKQLMDANSSLNTDHLTSASNRRAFDEYMKKLVHMHDISKAPLSAIILDIDFFKKINDVYGHDVGDFVLKECVRILKTVFFKEDEMVARVGGEEFVVVLPNHSIEQCIARAEALQAIVRNEAFVIGDHSIKFTVSMGIAQKLENEKLSEWLKRADTALYNSKNTGRNKFTLANATAKPKAA